MAESGVLLDIEGTTSSIHFVYEEMFPFVRRELDRFLDDQWGRPELSAAAEQIARDAGARSWAEWCPATSPAEQRRQLAAEVIRLMDGDVKATGLKQLQGLIWKSGFASGELRAHVYDDVVPALERWQREDRDVRVYSSGSVAAQHLFFGHTTRGDLRHHFRGHYDTTTGGKKEPESYVKIAADFGLPASSILFVSDVIDELQAARDAAMQVALARRPGNAPVPTGHGFREITSFEGV